MAPKQSQGDKQAIKVWHAGGNRTQKVETIKMRWRISYKVGSEVQQEMGEIGEFTVA